MSDADTSHTAVPNLAAGFHDQLETLCEQIDDLDGVVTLDLTIENSDSPMLGIGPTDGRGQLLIDLYDNAVEDAEQSFFDVETDRGQATLGMDEAVAVLQLGLQEHGYRPTHSQSDSDDAQQRWSEQFGGGKLSPPMTGDVTTS